MKQETSNTSSPGRTLVHLLGFGLLLALILMRKKVLNFKDVSKEGETSYLVLRDKEDTDHMVLDPKLDESAMISELNSALHLSLPA